MRGEYGWLTLRRLVAATIAVVMTLLLMVLMPKMVENVDASEIVLVQGLSGGMSWHTSPM